MEISQKRKYISKSCGKNDEKSGKTPEPEKSEKSKSPEKPTPQPEAKTKSVIRGNRMALQGGARECSQNSAHESIFD